MGEGLGVRGEGFGTEALGSLDGNTAPSDPLIPSP